MLNHNLSNYTANSNPQPNQNSNSIGTGLYSGSNLTPSNIGSYGNTNLNLYGINSGITGTSNLNLAGISSGIPGSSNINLPGTNTGMTGSSNLNLYGINPGITGNINLNLPGISSGITGPSNLNLPGISSGITGPSNLNLPGISTGITGPSNLNLYGLNTGIPKYEYNLSGGIASTNIQVKYGGITTNNTYSPSLYNNKINDQVPQSPNHQKQEDMIEKKKKSQPQQEQQSQFSQNFYNQPKNVEDEYNHDQLEKNKDLQKHVIKHYSTDKSNIKYSELTQDDKDVFAEKAKQLYFQATNKQKQDVSEFETAIKSCLIQGPEYKFTDDKFKPNLESLVGEYTCENAILWKQFKWKRASEFMKNPKIFNGDSNDIQQLISPNDIKQGDLGNCYLLSALASLAETPHRIHKLFVSQKYWNLPFDQQVQKRIETEEIQRKYGCYFVNVNIVGEWKEVVVDDYFPVQPKTNQPAFSHSDQDELWVLLLEKAYAKIYKSYDNIDAGHQREALHDFTGAPTKFLRRESPELWPTILKGESKNWPMTAGTPLAEDEDMNDDLDENQIVYGHAYSLLAGYDLNHMGKNVQLVKLRNPWGDSEWNGKWCDSDPIWNQISPQEKQRLQFDPNGKDGIFYMEFQDFLKHYEDAQFVMINDAFKYTTVSVQDSNTEGKWFSVAVKTRGVYFFTVDQDSRRSYPLSIKKDDDNFQYSQITLLVGKIEGDSIKYVEGHQKSDKEVWTSLGENKELEPGSYVVYIKTFWEEYGSSKFNLSVYGADEVNIESVPKQKNFLSKFYFDYAQNISTRKQNFAHRGEPNSFICIDYTDDGYHFAAAWNNGNKTMKIELKFKDLAKSNMKIKKPFQGPTVILELKPGEKGKCVVIRSKRKTRFYQCSQIVQFV